MNITPNDPLQLLNHRRSTASGEVGLARAVRNLNGGPTNRFGVHALREQLRSGAAASRMRSFSNGTILFREQEKPQFVFLIESGWVLLSIRRHGAIDRRGKWWSSHDDVPIAAATTGGLLGLVAALNRESLLFSATARGRCVCRMIERPSLEHALSTLEARVGSASHGFASTPGAVAISGRQGLLLLSHLFLLQPIQRVEHLLWTLSQSVAPSPSNGEVRLDISLTRDELGALVHVDGKTFSRALTELERGSKIRRENHLLILHDRNSLAHLPAGSDPTGIF